MFRRLFGLSVGAVFLTAIPLAPAYGQEMVMEEIIVTGSRIPRGDIEASSPINVIDSEDVSLSGIVNIEQLVNELPQIAPDLTATTNNGGSGVVTVDLRGLGAFRTLVLVNGRRAFASDAEGQVDINGMPASLIERVEVVTGGASAIYGSDAIAGAVNFILKDDFQGFEIGGQYNITGEKDADTRTVHVTLGGNFDDGRGNAVIYADYTDRDQVLAGDRDFSDVALTDIGVQQWFSVGSSRIPGGQIVQSDLTFPDGTVATNAKFQPDGTPIPAAGETFNFQPANYLLTPQERFLAHALARYEVTDTSEVYLEASYSNNQVDQQLAFDANDIPDAGPLFVPLTNPLVSANADLVTFLTTNFDQGTGGDVTALDGIATIPDFRRRMVEVGPRFNAREFDGYRILLGATGELPLQDGGWTYDAYYSFSRANVAETLVAFTSDARLQRALDATTDASGDPVCNDPSGGCVPISLFGNGALTPDGIPFVSPTAAIARETEQQIASVSVTGEPAELPAGPLAIAAGLEYREEKAKSIPDQFVQSGELGPGNDEDPVIGDYDVFELYAETVIPIVEGLQMAELIEVEGAFRVADYSTVGSNTTFKAGGSWTVRQGFKIRGLFQRAIRAPNINELFQGQAAGAESATDLCTASQIPVQAAALGRTVAEVENFCMAMGVPNPGVFVADAQVLTVTGGNPDLGEETADTFTVGFVAQPEEWIPNMTITLDYYDIFVEDAIDDLDADTVMGLCFESFDPNNSFCQDIDRNPANGSVQTLTATRANLASEERQGLDWEVDYGFDVFDGYMQLSHQGNYTLTNEFVPIAGAATVDCNGIFGGDCTGLGNFAQSKWRTTNTVTWSRGPYVARAQVRSIGNLENINKGGGVALVKADSEAEHYIDLVVSYDATENLNVVFGIDNLLDNDPPILGFDFVGLGGGADANTDPSLYDMLGRRFFLSLSWRAGL